MLSEADKKFMADWEAEQRTPVPAWRFLVRGVPIGLLIGLAIVALLTSGWYERASMQLVKLNPYFLLFSIVAITVFCAWIYRKFRQEMLGQRYEELRQKAKADAAILTKTPS